MNVVEMVLPETPKAATIMISTVPILTIYPFLQKYFARASWSVRSRAERAPRTLPRQGASLLLTQVERDQPSLPARSRSSASRAVTIGCFV